ncbi:MAG: hypothetical protein N4A47_07090 [Clostridia bacterium]|jgi:DNA polymerase|nr:hypothetical protein [Clostridia bacterium]
MPHNADPKPDNIKACINYLYEQINIVNPKIIIPVGLVATKIILDEKKIKLIDVAGKQFKWDGRIIIPSYHPSAARYNKNAIQSIIDAFKLAKDIVE